jgi:geranylgeranyl pyrophosphate synthase
MKMNTKEIINNHFHSNYINLYPSEVHEILIHLFNDGKRLRPVLFLAFNDFDNNKDNKDSSNDDNNSNNEILNTAIDIELIHCLSLVIDDLPEMDNELVRRNKICFHIKYGMVKTNFFIYYMFSKLLANLSSNGLSRRHINISSRIKLFQDANYIIQYLLANLIDGQYIDMEFNKLIKPETELDLDNNTTVVTELIMIICINLKLSITATFENYDYYDDDDEYNLDILYNYIILNIKKTGTLFALPVITGFLLQLYNKNAEYTGNETLVDNRQQNNATNNSTNNATNNNDVVGNELEKQMKMISNVFKIGDDNIMNLIITWAFLFGFFFQTSDDFLDMQEDALNQKPNICNVIGRENSKKLITKGIDICRSILEYINNQISLIWPNIGMSINTPNITEIFNIINSRIPK